MKPIFTVDAGEFLIAKEFERRGYWVWLPSKDTGIDLLVTDHTLKKSCPLQVKFSTDFSISDSERIGHELKLCGLFQTDLAALKKSSARYWVLLIASFKLRKMAHLIISPRTLYERLSTIHGWQTGKRHFFVWITTDGICWETNGLRKHEQLAVARGEFKDELRNLTPWMNNFEPIISELR